MATILFRPFFDFDQTDWVPILPGIFKDHDLRIWPAVGNPEDIEYLILWRLAPGDKTAWPNLKAILSISTGVNQYIDHPDMPDVPLIRMIEPGLGQGMAEYVTNFVMQFHTGAVSLQRAQAQGAWIPYIPTLAPQRRVGFLGLGHMARACIAALQPLGFSLRGWARTQYDLNGVECFSGKEGFEAFLRNTDILVCLLPLTPETQDIINARTLAMLPRGASLINAARGKHVVDEDLLSALDSGHIAHAALDVFRKEPLPEHHHFWTHPNVHVTPHIAAVTIPATGAQALLKAVKTIEAGETPPGLVDISRGY